MFGALDVSTSGLVAQRTRLQVIAANLANRSSLLDANGNYAPYRRRFAVLSAGQDEQGGPGVRVAQIQMDDAPLRKVYEPGSPYADRDGYVQYPNVEPAIEMVNALEATRAYEANITAAEATKSMWQTSLRLLA